MKKSAAAVPAPDNNWQAESDFRTLMDAHKIKSDKPRHAAAIAHAKKQLAAVTAMTAEPGETKAKEKGESKAEKKAEKKAGID